MTWILLAFMELASTVSPEAVLQSVRDKHQLSADISYTFSQTWVDELRGARAPETGTILQRKMDVSAGLTKRLSGRILSLTVLTLASTSPVNHRPLSLKGLPLRLLPRHRNSCGGGDS